MTVASPSAPTGPVKALGARFTANTLRHEHKVELTAILGQVFAQADAEVWVARLAAHDIPSGPINTIDRVVREPQVLARQMIAETEHPVAGRVSVLGNPIKLSGADETFAPSPLYGQHNAEILRDLLGYGAEDVQQFSAAGVFGQAYA